MQRRRSRFARAATPGFHRFLTENAPADVAALGVADWIWLMTTVCVRFADCGVEASIRRTRQHHLATALWPKPVPLFPRTVRNTAYRVPDPAPTGGAKVEPDPAGG